MILPTVCSNRWENVHNALWAEKKQFTKSYAQYEPILTEAKIIYLCREIKIYVQINFLYWIYLIYPNTISSCLLIIGKDNDNGWWNYGWFLFSYFDSILFSAMSTYYFCIMDQKCGTQRKEMMLEAWGACRHTYQEGKNNDFLIFYFTAPSTVGLEKEMATHSSFLAWRTPMDSRAEGPQSMGSQRVGHDWVT